MSLILEALRKSEAERRRGNTPDVAMELPPAPPSRARAMPAWVVPAILVAAIASLAAWWWSQHDANPASATAAVAATPTDAPHVEPPAQPVVIARQPAPPPAPTPAAPVPRGITPIAYGESEPPVISPAPPLPAPANDPPAIDATSMPQAKLSMHMWDESPARRFVILNGQRMGEGDRNGDITVIGIERDGVVVERNGQRAKIALP